jgi:hypothetical protein
MASSKIANGRNEGSELDTALTESVESDTRDTRRRALPCGMGGGRRGSLAPIGRETPHQRLVTNDITYAFIPFTTCRSEYAGKDVEPCLKRVTTTLSSMIFGSK